VFIFLALNIIIITEAYKLNATGTLPEPILNSNVAGGAEPLPWQGGLVPNGKPTGRKVQLKSGVAAGTFKTFRRKLV